MLWPKCAQWGLIILPPLYSKLSLLVQWRQGVTASSGPNCGVVGICHGLLAQKTKYCQSHGWHQRICYSVLEYLNPELSCASCKPSSGAEGTGVWLEANHWVDSHSWPHILASHSLSMFSTSFIKCLKNTTKYRNTMTGISSFLFFLFKVIFSFKYALLAHMNLSTRYLVQCRGLFCVFWRCFYGNVDLSDQVEECLWFACLRDLTNGRHCIRLLLLLCVYSSPGELEPPC